MCINENIFKFNELGLLPPGCHEGMFDSKRCN